MARNVQDAAGAFVAPQLLRNIKFRWIVMGVAAYYALRYLSRRGILPEKADAALDLIDKGIDTAKQSVGLAAGEAAREHTGSRRTSELHH
jgi:hypothetical protein